jgi:hypothetical protein
MSKRKKDTLEVTSLRLCSLHVLPCGVIQIYEMNKLMCVFERDRAAREEDALLYNVNKHGILFVVMRSARGGSDFARSISIHISISVLIIMSTDIVVLRHRRHGTTFRSVIGQRRLF